MSGYIGAIPTPQATQSRDVYTATSNQTTFTTQGYTPGFVSVYLNGVHLARADFTATNGSDVVLASGATANDTVEIVSFGTFQSADALPLTGGTVTGTVNFPDGSISISDLDIDGGTDIGAALVDADLMVVDDGAGGTNRKATMSRLATYMGTKISAGEATFTATGAITAGNPVGFNANGTVSAMQQQVGTPVSLGSGAGSGAVGRQPLAYDTANDKYLHVFVGTNTKLFARVGTVTSNFGLSFGTAVDSGITLSSNVAARGELYLVYDDNAGKFVVSYCKSDDKGYASTITISGTTPSFGTEVNVFNSLTYHTEVGYDSNANKVLFLSAGNQDSITGRVGTISGTDITLGSASDLGGTAQHPIPSSLTFDTTANKFVYFYGTGSYGQPLKARTMTISGTSVSAGSEISVDGSQMPSNRTANAVYDPSINKTVAIYVNGSTPVFKLLTISGTSLSAGTETTIPFATTPAHQAFVQNHVQAVVDPDNNGLIFGYSTVNSSTAEPGGTCVTPGTFSGSTLTLGVEVRVSTSKALAGLLYDPDTDQTIVGTSGYGVADSAEDQVVNANSGTRPAYVGVAAESISNGATGKVTIIGGVNANQSGLSAGSQYGIPTSSSSLIATDTNPVGIAISSTEIYLRAVSL